MRNDSEVVRRFAVLALVALLLVPACGGDVDPARTPAGRAQVQLLHDLYNGRALRSVSAS